MTESSAQARQQPPWPPVWPPLPEHAIAQQGPAGDGTPAPWPTGAPSVGRPTAPASDWSREAAPVAPDRQPAAPAWQQPSAPPEWHDAAPAWQQPSAPPEWHPAGVPQYSAPQYGAAQYGEQYGAPTQDWWAPAGDGQQPGRLEPEDRRSGGRGVWVLLAAVLVVVVAAAGGWLVLRDTGRNAMAAPSATSADPTTSPAESPAERDGPVQPGLPLQPVSVTATCQADAGVDSAGDPISYEPELTTDGRVDTAWRCAGSAVGAQLVYDFGRTVTITDVALVPGYAKVDPVDGTDRFAQNRTVAAVTWRFDDGDAHLQRLPSPSPSLTGERLPGPVTTTRVVLEIAGTGNDGAVRDFTAISDVQISGY